MSEEMFKQAVQAARTGQRARAKDLLTRLIKADQSNLDYWIWMSAVVDTEKEQIFCLQNALKIDPNSQAARRGLVTLGAMRPEEAGLIMAPPPAEEASVELPTSTRQSLNAFDRALMSLPGGLGAAFSRPRNRLVATFALAGLAIALVMICLAVVGSGAVRAFFRPTAVAAVPSHTPTPSLTPSPTLTLTPTATLVPCAAPDNPNPSTPLAAYLCLTQTPTPIPVATDPARSEESFDSVEKAYGRGDWSTILGPKATAAVADLPNNARLSFYFAEAYRHTNALSNALKNYNASIKQDANFAPAYWGKALVEVAQGNTNAALKDWDSAIKTDPNFVPSYLDRAAYYSAVRNFGLAQADLEAAKLVAPGNAQVLASLANVYVDLATPQAALDTAEQALKMDGGLALAFYARGRASYALGQFADANHDLSLAYPYVLAMDAPFPNLNQAIVGYNVALGKIGVGDDATALTLLTQAIGVYKSGYPLAYLARGNLYLRAQTYDSARADFNAAISQFQATDANNPALNQAYLGNGLAFLGLHKPDSAITNFQTVARRDPANFPAQLYWGRALVESGGSKNAQNAVDILTAALDLTQSESDTALVYFWRAQAYESLGRTLEEVADLTALSALGDASKALIPTAIARLTQMGPVPTATFTPLPTGRASPTPTGGKSSPSPTATATRKP